MSRAGSMAFHTTLLVDAHGVGRNIVILKLITSVQPTLSDHQRSTTSILPPPFTHQCLTISVQPLRADTHGVSRNTVILHLDMLNLSDYRRQGLVPWLFTLLY